MQYLTRFILATLLALCISACVSPQAMVAQNAAPLPTSGYVAGIFSGRGHNYAFGLRNSATNVEVHMPFFDKGLLTVTNEPEQLNMIALAPGTYQVTHWLTFSTLGEVLTRTRLDGEGKQAIVFDVKPGRVTFIGKIGVVESQDYRWHRFGIRPKAARAAELAWAFKHTYPAFSMEIVDPASGTVVN